MRGMPTPCIKYYAEQHHMRVLKLYEYLFNNNAVTFDSTNDGNKYVCSNNLDHTVSNIRNGEKDQQGQLNLSEIMKIKFI